MERKDIRNAVLSHLAAQGTKYVPAGVSARHVHLSQADLDCLFGPGHSLHPCKALSQPGQFAAQERVTVAGPRGELAGVRVLGPVRGKTQVEVAFSEVKRLGIPGQVRMSGDVDGTPGCTLKGPAGQLTIPQGVIVPARHLHLSPLQAACFGLKDGQPVSLRMGGQRAGLLEQVICRVGEGHDLEVHLDTDEANALCVTDGDLLELVSPEAEKKGGCSCGGGCHGSCQGTCGGHHAAPEPPPAPVNETEPMDLVTERDVEEAWKRGIAVIRCLPRCIVTDAARERAMSLDVEIKR
ncbi:MAG: phosphate propanoyltransferase [Lawsonibacter sp.]|jgi:putative phosphotransacetylase|nr:phosphate propanoyltransferase [Lawsonibacter sp.]